MTAAFWHEEKKSNSQLAGPLGSVIVFGAT
jgi:hypothetical protein